MALTVEIRGDAGPLEREVERGVRAVQQGTATMRTSFQQAASGTQQEVGKMGRAFGDMERSLRSADQATRTMGQSLGGLTIGLRALSGVLGGLVSVSALTGLARSVLQADDALAKLSVSTGLSVETLSTLKPAADLAGTSIQSVATAMRQMQVNVAQAVRGTGEALPILRQMGFSIDDMRRAASDPEGFLEQFAIRLDEIDAAGARTEARVRVLGRSAEELAPLMQQLAQEGFGVLRAEAERLGLVVSQDAARAAEQFNDSLRRLGQIAQGLMRSALGPLIQGFVDLSVAMGLIKETPLQSVVRDLEQIRDRVQRSIDELQRGLQFDSWIWRQLFGVRDPDAAKARLQELQGQLEGLNQSLEALRQPTTAGGTPADDPGEFDKRLRLEKERQELLARQQLIIAKQALDDEIRLRVRAGEELTRLQAEQRDRVAGLELQHAQAIYQIQVKFAKAGTNERMAADTQWAEAYAKHEEDTTKLVIQEAQKRRDEYDKMLAQMQRINDQIMRDNERILGERRRQVDRELEEEARAQERAMQRQLDEQARAYESFVGQVTNSMSRLFRGLMDGTLTMLDFFKQTFLQAIADLAASVASRAIIVPIIGNVVGGIAGALSPTLGAGILGALGLGPLSGLTTAISVMTNFFTDLPVQMASALGVTMYPSGFVGPIPTAQQLGTSAVVSGISPWGAIGGAAGIGAGIYTALGAQNAISMGLSSAGAAGGALALATAIGPAIGLALNPIFMPIGLALSALLPLIGSFITLGRKGPRLEFGAAGGAQAELGPDSTIILTGEITVPITRAERVGGEIEIQQALESGLTQIATNMLTMINTVALDSSLLLDETNAAMQRAFQDIHQIQTSSRRNFARDIEDQMALIFTQFTVAFLDPLTSAFRQLETGTLHEQIQRLPQATAAMVETLAGLNQAFEDLSQRSSADVRRQLDTLRA